ncbi:HNH endonuclease [Rhodobacter sp. KR11]|uniref:HNH endonuclease signature motif containing protein n=1 Tax=Rhodobacter sp. KR11 TaxID=2974588 RepID=UPI002221F4D8|nr:HNH endonuclease [Rhodobacter sp. KR11]MCW1919974.1 HNH endonuclease [Rhodobacter sp. KR11]
MTRARKRRHDLNRPSARERGYTTDWDKARKEYLAFHPVCAMCGNAATLVDHITPHKGDKTLFWDWRNWQALCVHCHCSRKQGQEANMQLRRKNI